MSPPVTVQVTCEPPAQCVPPVNIQVLDSALALNQTVEENLVQLETAYQEQTDYVSIVQKLQGQLDELVKLMVDVPFWSNTDISLEELARQTETFDFYRSVLDAKAWFLLTIPTSYDHQHDPLSQKICLWRKINAGRFFYRFN